MKYWRGYLAAIIFAAITWGFVSFAKEHPVLVDLVYPYLTRIYTSSVTGWAAGTATCVWQILILFGVVAIVASGVLMVMFKWNIVQWLGWILAAVVGVNMITTLSSGLNAYASPLADDIRLNVSDYTVTELNEAALYFRDQANRLSVNLPRDEEKNITITSFDDVAAVGHLGFDVLTYEKANSVFACVTDAPVKKLSMPGLFAGRGESGVTVAITGESAVNPHVPNAALPFAICKELSARISIYSEADTNFAAYLACINHPDQLYQYSGYLMAYYYCREALLSIPTSTAQGYAEQVSKNIFDIVVVDLLSIYDFYGDAEVTANVQAQANITASDSEITLISFSSYSDVTDLLVSWHIQDIILPNQPQDSTEPEFDPYNKNEVFNNR